MRTYHHFNAVGSATTETDQLNGTPVENAGRQGKVWASFTAAAGEVTGKLRGRTSGIEVIPNGSHAVEGLGEHGRIVYYADGLTPGEPLDLEFTTTAAQDVSVMVTVD